MKTNTNAAAPSNPAPTVAPASGVAEEKIMRSATEIGMELDNEAAQLQKQLDALALRRSALADKRSEERLAQINKLPVLLGVETLAIVASLISSVMKTGKIPSEVSELTDRKERVLLTLPQKLDVLARRSGETPETMQSIAEHYKVSIGTVNNICSSDKKAELIEEARKTKVALPAALTIKTPVKKS